MSSPDSASVRDRFRGQDADGLEDVDDPARGRRLERPQGCRQHPLEQAPVPAGDLQAGQRRTEPHRLSQPGVLGLEAAAARQVVEVLETVGILPEVAIPY